MNCPSCGVQVMSRRETTADRILQTLILFAREREDVTAIRMKTRGFLLAAAALRVDDPTAPPRVVPEWPMGSSWLGGVAPVVETFDLKQVRVGTSFEIHGPAGAVVIEEDPD